MGTNNDKLTEMHDRLAKAVESLVSGEDWKKMLELSRRFHTYSANNVFLILAQRPEATRVAGYRTWSSLGRHVMRGERGIAILAPCVYRARPLDENDERDHPELAKVLRGFRVVHVFDVAQTDGEPIPDVAPVLLQDDAPASLWQLLADQVTSQGYELSRGDCRPANGTTNYATRTVVVRDDLAAAQATKTLAHELAHVMLHGGIGSWGSPQHRRDRGGVGRLPRLHFDGRRDRRLQLPLHRQVVERRPRADPQDRRARDRLRAVDPRRSPVSSAPRPLLRRSPRLDESSPAAGFDRPPGLSSSRGCLHLRSGRRGRGSTPTRARRRPARGTRPAIPSVASTSGSDSTNKR